MWTDFAAVGRLLASPARAAVVDALLDGRALAAGELAQLAGVKASTISEHLSELVEGGLLSVVSAGRHRYYRLAGPDVAEALESLARICPPAPIRSLRQSGAERSLRLARVCYDHLAGALGVAVLSKILTAGWLASATDIPQGHDFEISQAGRAGFTELGVDLDACRRSRRIFARSCLDWSERRMHLAGAVGADMTTALLNRQWLRRTQVRRGLAITAEGERGLLSVFGIDVPRLREASEDAVRSLAG